jgi:hypothetical protein
MRDTLSLITLIQKGGLDKVATATTATVATQEVGNTGTVAEVANVAVAIRQKQNDWESVIELKQIPCLERRLEAAGFFVGIDRATGSALVVFSHSDAEAVRAVATVYRPGEVKLTVDQRRELTQDLNYYERLMERKATSPR